MNIEDQMQMEMQIEMHIENQIKESKLEKFKKARLLNQITNIKAPSGIHKAGRECDVNSKKQDYTVDKTRKSNNVMVGTKPS